MTHLLLIGGLPAAGKTTLGHEISRLNHFAFLDKDTLSLPFTEKLLLALDSGAHDRESGAYTHTVRPLEYQALLNTAKENVSLGISTVVVAPFLREMVDSQWLKATNADISQFCTQVHYLWLEASNEATRSRLIERGFARDRHKLDHWEDYVASAREIRPSDPQVLIVSPLADARATAQRLGEELLLL